MAQTENSGDIIPQPGSVPAFSLEAEFDLPPHYTLSDSVDLSPWFPPPGNQRRQASCTTWALCYGAMGYALNRSLGRTYTPLDTADPATTYSPAFLFNLLKQRDDEACTTNASFENVVKLAQGEGCCRWSEMPYDTAWNGCLEAVPLRAMQEAGQFHLPELIDIDPTNKLQWQYHLDQGRPIITEITIDSLFFQGGYATHGDSMLHWRYIGPVSYWGGHAVVCTGYENDSTFSFINSYGTRWGCDGYFTASWDMIFRRCYGAHVLMPDTSNTDLLPLLPAGNRTLNGERVKKGIRPGRSVRVNHALVQLAALTPDQERAVVRVVQPSDHEVLHTLHLRPGRTMTIYGNGKRTDYMYSKPSIPGRWFKRPIRLIITTTDIASDPYLARRDTLLRRLHAGMR